MYGIVACRKASKLGNPAARELDVSEVDLAAGQVGVAEVDPTTGELTSLKGRGRVKRMVCPVVS
jgi:hypothetical protein